LVEAASARPSRDLRPERALDARNLPLALDLPVDVEVSVQMSIALTGSLRALDVVLPLVELEDDERPSASAPSA